ncbi:unnamed protein product [Lepidochelys kempii]
MAHDTTDEERISFVGAVDPAVSFAILSHQAFATAIIFMTCTEKTQANFTCHWNNELSALLFCYYGIGWGSRKYSHLLTFCPIQRHKTTHGNIFLSKLLVLWESSPVDFLGCIAVPWRQTNCFSSPHSFSSSPK